MMASLINCGVPVLLHRVSTKLKHHDFGIYPELLNGEALKLRQGRNLQGLLQVF